MTKLSSGRVLRMSRDRIALEDYVIWSYRVESLVFIGSRIKVSVHKGIRHIYGAIGLTEKGHPAMS